MAAPAEMKGWEWDEDAAFGQIGDAPALQERYATLAREAESSGRVRLRRTHEVLDLVEWMSHNPESWGDDEGHTPLARRLSEARRRWPGAHYEVGGDPRHCRILLVGAPLGEAPVPPARQSDSVAPALRPANDRVVSMDGTSVARRLLTDGS